MESKGEKMVMKNLGARREKIPCKGVKRKAKIMFKAGGTHLELDEIGRASCRERV